MKFRLYFITLLMMSLFFAACKDSSSTDPDPEENGDIENYLPNSVGTTYTFDVITRDSAGVTENGNRITTYTGTVTLNGPLYTEQTDSLVSNAGDTSTKSYFRKTDNGAYYYLDTAGLGNTVPDSLLQYITFDPEFRYLAFPLNEGSSWPVFKMNLSYIVNLTVIEVSANVVGKENVTLNLNTGQETKEALKIRYTLTVRIPNTQTLEIITTTFEGFSWIVKNIGVVKMEGDASVLNAFSGAGIDIDDPTTVTQELVQYSIK